MKRTIGFCIAVLFFMLSAGCSQATSGNAGNSGSSNVAGKVVGINFAAKYTSASEVSSGYITVNLWGQNSLETTRPNTATYPYVTFSLLKTSQPKTYVAHAYGLPSNGLTGIRVTGWSSPTGGTYFDSGELTITTFDLNTKTVVGSFKGLATTEGTSSLDGNFTAKIE